jgi:hypothetical protein
VFAGFDLMIVSELWHNTPPTRPPIAVQFDTKSVGETSGPDIVKLYPAIGDIQQPNPWAQVPEGDRQVSTPTLEAQEIYAIFIVAYIKPHTVRFSFGRLFWRTWLHRSSGRPELHFVREWDEEEIKDFTWKTPFQSDYSRTVTHSEGRVSATRTLTFKISDDGYGCRFSTSAQAQKQDSRSRFMDEWVVDPSHRAVTWHSLNFLISIANPAAKEVTVRFDYTQSLTEPPGLGPPLGDDPLFFSDLWFVTTDLGQLIAEADDSMSVADIFKKNMIGIYRRYDTNGSKEFKFRDKQIVLYVYWNPAALDLHKEWLHRLNYSASSTATLEITVSGLKGR